MACAKRRAAFASPASVLLAFESLFLGKEFPLELAA
jgi:hypothetical protein